MTPRRVLRRMSRWMMKDIMTTDFLLAGISLGRKCISFKRGG
jgi:hypothetical protein